MDCISSFGVATVEAGFSWKKLAQRYSCRWGKGLAGIALILLVASEGRAALLIDFNDNLATSPTQTGYTPVKRTGASGITSDVGTVDIAVTSTSGDELTDPIAGGPGLPISDLLRDFIFNSPSTGLVFTVSGLLAGDYDFKGYFHDSRVGRGTFDLFVDNGDGEVQVLDDVAYSGRTTPDPIGIGAFSFSANGTDPVAFRIVGSLGLNLISGFEITVVPEPSSILIPAIGFSLVLLRSRSWARTMSR